MLLISIAPRFDARFEADGLQNLVGFERLLFAVRRGAGDADVPARVFDVVYARSGHNLDAVAPELAVQLRRHLFVLQRRDAIKKLHDGHIHALDGGIDRFAPNLQSERLELTGFLDAIARMLERTPTEEPDGWLNVFGWEPLSMASPPNRADLDDLPTRRPILVTDSSSHTSVANSRALELSGVDASTPDPGAGRIGRGDRNEPNGLLYDEAIVLVSGHIPPDTPEQNRRALRAAHEQMARMGVTSYLDVWTRGPDLEAHATLSDAGEVLVRPSLSLEVTPTGAADTQALLARLDRLREEHGRPGIAIRTAKLFLDGVIEYPAQTAALLEPYLDGDGRPTSDRGPTYFPQELTDRTVAALDGAGWQVHMHAIGDRAVRSALDAIEFARGQNGDLDNRHTLAHIEAIDSAEFKRFRQLNAMANMQMQWAERDS